MPSFKDVLTWDGTALRDAGEELVVASKSYEYVYGELDGLKVEGLEGEIAEAEAKARRILADDAMDLWTALDRGGKDLQDAGNSADALAAEALDIQATATNDHFTISDSGEVTDVSPALESDSSLNDAYTWPSSREATKLALKARIGVVLEQAGDVEVFLEGVYNNIAQVSTIAQGPSASVVNHGDRQPPASWSAQDVNDWWTAMTPQQRQHIIDTHPAWIGNLDGIPAEDRHAANMVWLSVMKARIDKQVEDHEPKTIVVHGSLGSRHVVKTVQYQNLLDRQAEIHAFYDQFNSPESDKETYRHTLLVLDDSGEHFRAAVGSGNIDTSDHVMVFTPGMTSTVDATLIGQGSTTWGSGVRDTDNTLDEARRQLAAQGRDDESVAGVTWLGYDAPNWEETLSNDDSSVLRQDEAREGAASLSSFYNGLQATHHGDPHLDSSGHSYGSVVNGLALQQTDVADELEVHGSPGTGSADASDMGLLPDHMAEASAAKDTVAFSGAHGRPPQTSPDFAHMETDAHSNPRYDGNPKNGGPELPGSEGHSQYSRLGEDGTPSTSLYNRASVLIGDGVTIPEEG